MKKRFGRDIKATIKVVAALLICFLVAFLLALAFSLVIVKIMGHEVSPEPTLFFKALVLVSWLFLLFLWGKLPFGDKFLHRDQIVQGMAVTITVLAIVIGCLGVAFLFTGFIYNIITGHGLPDEVPVCFKLGIVFNWILFLSLSKWYLKHRNIAKYITLFAAVIRVLESIAKGNFHVRLDERFKENASLGNLVKSVNSMASDLDRMEKMRQEFISNVSHEIQSPLASIRGFARALQNQELSFEERKRYLSIIESESMRLSRLSDNLLKLAVLESDSMRLELKPYRLDRQLRELILASEPQWRDKQIELDVSLNEITITADEDKLSQVWLNLIHNSVKFTPEGGKVRIYLSRQGEYIVFKISDTGIGIVEEDQRYIFDRFYKADKSRTPSKKGGGLGLAIVKKIINMHSGKISVESKPGAGATFIIFLPVDCEERKKSRNE